MAVRSASPLSMAVQGSSLSITAGNLDNITYAMGIYSFGGNGHVSYLLGQTTPSITTAKTIIIVTGDGSNISVVGSDGTNKFSDTVMVGLADTPAVSVTHTVAGSPAARTYTNSGSGALQLAMATGTYAVAALGYSTGQR